jgi:putative glutamine amidotransferase
MTDSVIVVVSQRVELVAARQEWRDALDQRLVSFLLRAGTMPVPVPNGLSAHAPAGQKGGSNFEAWIGRVNPQAVVLSGGNDIGECTDRDTTEKRLLDFAQTNRLPVLGICRGMQMMGIWAGGRLAQVRGHAGQRHRLLAVEQPADLPSNVNSYHDWSLVGCPEGFALVARSEDGGIEAIRHLHLPWEGWMWHPEREADFAEVDIRRAKKLLAAQ